MNDVKMGLTPLDARQEETAAGSVVPEAGAVELRCGDWVIHTTYPNGNVVWIKREVKEFGDTGIAGNFHTFWTLPPGVTPTPPRQEPSTLPVTHK